MIVLIAIAAIVTLLGLYEELIAEMNSASQIFHYIQIRQPSVWQCAMASSKLVDPGSCGFSSRTTTLAGSHPVAHISFFNCICL